MAKILQMIKNSERWKPILHQLLMHPVKTRPRLWLRLLQLFYLKRGHRSVIYRSVRKDLVPFRSFSIGSYSVVEDYSILNNAVGDVSIGNYSRIGLGGTVIGPVKIGNRVNFGQHVVISGLNHKYQDVNLPIDAQGVDTALVSIKDDVWVGANSVITEGVTLGEHCIIGAGSVVTKNIPPYSVALGNPAKVVKFYDFEEKSWVRL